MIADYIRWDAQYKAWHREQRTRLFVKALGGGDEYKRWTIRCHHCRKHTMRFKSIEFDGVLMECWRCGANQLHDYI